MATTRSLKDMLAEGPLPLARAAAIGAQLAAALRDRHEAGAGVHRSVSPGRVQVTWDGRGQPVVTLSEPDGTAEPPYLAPEQWRGEAVDERADVYAAAAVVLHMVQGVPPRPASSDRPPRFGGVPDALARVLRTALSQQPAERLASAAVLFEALGAAHRELAAQP